MMESISLDLLSSSEISSGNDLWNSFSSSSSSTPKQSLSAMASICCSSSSVNLAAWMAGKDNKVYHGLPEWFEGSKMKPEYKSKITA